MKIDQEVLYKELDQFLSNYTGTDIIYIKKIAPELGVNYLTLMFYLKKDQFKPLLDKIYNINTRNAVNSNSPVRTIKAKKNEEIVVTFTNDELSLYDRLQNFINVRFNENKQIKLCRLHEHLNLNQNTINKAIYTDKFKPLREQIKRNNLFVKDSYKKNKQNKPEKELKEYRFEREGYKYYILHNGFIERSIADYNEMVRMMKAGCKRGILSDYEKQMERIIFKNRRFDLYLDYIDKIIKESREQYKFLLKENNDN